MKGPYERLKYDFRRGWECPVCKRKEKTDFTVTFRHCACGTKKDGGQPVVMALVDDGVRRVWWPPKRLEAITAAAPHVDEDAVVDTIPESAASIPEATLAVSPPPADETPPADAPPANES